MSTFNEIKDWPLDVIDEQIKRLENSVYHLERTNKELLAFLPKKSQNKLIEGSFEAQSIGSRDQEIQAMEDEEQLRRLSDDNGDDTELLNGVIKENEYTIASQNERISLLKYAKALRLNTHEEAPKETPPAPSTGLEL
ncbi:hypothetical protein E3Q17_03201 [Wallemia mellicola]|uniref:Uncharacterized protein n=1 Tax=Wallemia mellicola TaxID=1708541 RepID=A0A4T0NNF8_9BASI|nr:hypothetical protein E3Q17_03201 [Wallemia mellicola]